MKEQWRGIQNFEGFYEVSNFGRVRSLDREVLHNKKKGFKRKIKGKVLSSNKTNGIGYKIVSLRGSDVKFNGNKLIHRLVAEAFIENKLNLPIVNHIDGDPSNCRFDNLEWTDYRRNMNHAVENGLIKKGEKHKNHILSKKEVNEIYHAKGIQRTIGDRYGISQTQVWAIKNKLRRSEDLDE